MSSDGADQAPTIEWENTSRSHLIGASSGLSGPAGQLTQYNAQTSGVVEAPWPVSRRTLSHPFFILTFVPPANRSAESSSAHVRRPPATPRTISTPPRPSHHRGACR